MALTRTTMYRFRRESSVNLIEFFHNRNAGSYYHVKFLEVLILVPDSTSRLLSIISALLWGYTAY